MKDYPNYSVAQVNSVSELFCYCTQQHGTLVAFQRTDGQITYHQLGEAILQVAGTIMYRNNFIHVCAEDPMLFAIGYFATVLTGNAAVLIDINRHQEDVQLPPAVLTLTDE